MDVAIVVDEEEASEEAEDEAEEQLQEMEHQPLVQLVPIQLPKVSATCEWHRWRSEKFSSLFAELSSQTQCVCVPLGLYYHTVWRMSTTNIPSRNRGIISFNFVYDLT